jgi:ABC-2 type transport system permease protein
VAISAIRAFTQGGPTAHYVWQSAAWTAALLIVFGSLAVMEYRKA